MGVAVITSTSGCTPFCTQAETLHHAEAMLLVDDREAELLELDILFEQRVRADHHMRPVLRPTSFLSCDFSRLVNEPVSSTVT